MLFFSLEWNATSVRGYNYKHLSVVLSFVHTHCVLYPFKNVLVPHCTSKFLVHYTRYKISKISLLQRVKRLETSMQTLVHFYCGSLRVSRKWDCSYRFVKRARYYSVYLVIHVDQWVSTGFPWAFNKKANKLLQPKLKVFS